MKCCPDQARPKRYQVLRSSLHVSGECSRTQATPRASVSNWTGIWMKSESLLVSHSRSLYQSRLCILIRHSGVTYQNLRQICNPDCEAAFPSYAHVVISLFRLHPSRVDQVPSFKPTAPGDQCDDPMSAYISPSPVPAWLSRTAAPCCCNTVAFALSMLCMK